MESKIVFESTERALRAELYCEIDHHTAAELRERIDARMFEERPKLLVLDFCGVKFMDSSGLGLILGRAEVARALGASVRLTGLSEGLVRLLRLGGLDRVKNLTVGK